MIRLQPSQLREGMQVGADVTTPDGRILLKKGALLTAPFIQKLGVLNVDEIPIEMEREEAHLSTEPSFQASSAIREMVEKKFAGIERNPVIEALMSLSEKHLQELAAEKKEE